jgi:hypothetical protein
VTVVEAHPQQAIQEVMPEEERAQEQGKGVHRPIKIDPDSHKIGRARPLKTGECSKHLHKTDNSSNKEIQVPMCIVKMHHVQACNKVELQLRQTEACMVEAWEAEAWAAVWAEAWEDAAWVVAVWAVVAVVVVVADRNALF